MFIFAEYGFSNLARAKRCCDLVQGKYPNVSFQVQDNGRGGFDICFDDEDYSYITRNTPSTFLSREEERDTHIALISFIEGFWQGIEGAG